MTKKKQHRKEDFIPPYLAAFGALHLEISGNREVILEGGRGIVEYNDDSVKVNTGKMIVGFGGRGLTIKSMTDSSIVIQGFITSIEFIM